MPKGRNVQQLRRAPGGAAAGVGWGGDEGWGALRMGPVRQCPWGCLADAVAAAFADAAGAAAVNKEVQEAHV